MTALVEAGRLKRAAYGAVGSDIVKGCTSEEGCVEVSEENSG